MSSLWPLNWFKSPEPLKPPSPPPSPATLGAMIKTDLKDYFVDPTNKVLDDPTRALVYSIGIKMISLFVAIVFPFIGYTAFGLSVALIDRIIVLNLRDFTTELIKRINADCIQSLIKTILGPVTESKK